MRTDRRQCKVIGWKDHVNAAAYYWLADTTSSIAQKSCSRWRTEPCICTRLLPNESVTADWQGPKQLIPSECASQPLTCGTSTPQIMSFLPSTSLCKSKPYPTLNGSTGASCCCAGAAAAAGAGGDTVALAAQRFL